MNPFRTSFRNRPPSPLKFVLRDPAGLQRTGYVDEFANTAEVSATTETTRTSLHLPQRRRVYTNSKRTWLCQHQCHNYSYPDVF